MLSPPNPPFTPKRTAPPAIPKHRCAPKPSPAPSDCNVQGSTFKVQRSALLLFASSCLFSSALACKVPVFRFALERWAADPILLQVNAPESDPALILLRSLSPAPNFRLKSSHAPGSAPGLSLRLPGSPAGSPAWWQGPLTPETAAALADSPARQLIARHLLAGESAVWLVVSSGDPARDSAARDLLVKALARASRDLSLPSGVIPGADASARLSDDPQASLDDVLRSPLPLRISFVTETLSSSDPAEDVFRGLLRKLSPLPAAPGEPLLLPVFGRGRGLLPAPVSRLDENAVFRACALLCGACACTVKERNPGVDLPFAVNWNTSLRLTLPSVERPALTSEVSVTAPSSPETQPADPAPESPATFLVLTSALLLTLGALLFLRHRSA